MRIVGLDSDQDPRDRSDFEFSFQSQLNLARSLALLFDKILILKVLSSRATCTRDSRELMDIRQQRPE